MEYIGIQSLRWSGEARGFGRAGGISPRRAASREGRENQGEIPDRIGPLSLFRRPFGTGSSDSLHLWETKHQSVPCSSAETGASPAAQPPPAPSQGDATVTNPCTPTSPE